ncbi:MAG: hypothetical protein A3F41_06005 [Coxiella sp. RIFCSPHIGHO2_12_FULL_44_14]|nr:MAG: hypothetical protein A3F41_06005 [Coxiella sp. RIFCSPHIGHO2_12_FULL_44_14]
MPVNPFQGFGIGLRPCHYSAVLDILPDLDWLEIISEDFMVEGGNTLYYLDLIRERYPLVLHGVSLSIGSSDDLDGGYLKQLRRLIDRVHPLWVSDHLCWTGVRHTRLHDLMPLAYTEETLAHVVERVRKVQDYLGQPILLENIASYITYRASTLSEWKFLTQIVDQTGCFILLDINNLFVNAFNHGWDVREYLVALPKNCIRQLHIAGHQDCQTHILDTHGAAIDESVWEWYRQTIRYLGPVATSIERDTHIPPLEDLLQELDRAKQTSQEVRDVVMA